MRYPTRLMIDSAVRYNCNLYQLFKYDMRLTGILYHLVTEFSSDLNPLTGLMTNIFTHTLGVLDEKDRS